MSSAALPEPVVSVIIPTYNRKDSLLRTLASLSTQTYPTERFEIIVVDDGGSDGTAEVAARPYHFALKVLRQENQGEIVARNAGVQLSSGELLVFLDDDIEVSRHYLEAIVTAHLAHPHAVVLGAIVEGSEDERTSALLAANAASAARADPRPTTYIDCMSGVVSISRDGFYEIGAMQPLRVGEGRNIWGGIDFGFRAFQHRFSFWRSADAVAIHHDDAAGSLTARCRRHQRVSRAVHQLFVKYPELEGQIPMFRDKGPIAWREDPLDLVLRKLARQAASSRPAMWAMTRAVPVLERHASTSIPLKLLYRWIVSGHIYHGYRTGLKERVR